MTPSANLNEGLYPSKMTKLTEKASIIVDELLVEYIRFIPVELVSAFSRLILIGVCSYVLRLKPLMKTLYFNKSADCHLFLNLYVSGKVSAFEAVDNETSPISISSLLVDKKLTLKFFQLEFELNAILKPALV